MKGFGVMMWLIGACIFGFAALVFEVSIPTSSEFISSGRVVNTGLLQQQMLIALAGLALFLAGVFVHAASEIVETIQRPNSASEASSQAASDDNIYKSGAF